MCRLVLKSIDMSSMDALEREETLNEAKVMKETSPVSFWCCWASIELALRDGTDGPSPLFALSLLLASEVAVGAVAVVPAFGSPLLL